MSSDTLSTAVDNRPNTGGSSTAIVKAHEKLETGWYFDDISDTDPMLPEDDRERAIIALLKVKTVEQILQELSNASAPVDSANRA